MCVFVVGVVCLWWVLCVCMCCVCVFKVCVSVLDGEWSRVVATMLVEF